MMLIVENRSAAARSFNALLLDAYLLRDVRNYACGVDRSVTGAAPRVRQCARVFGRPRCSSRGAIRVASSHFTYALAPDQLAAAMISKARAADKVTCGRAYGRAIDVLNGAR